jgi:tyrosyl-tRNA synthetase
MPTSEVDTLEGKGVLDLLVEIKLIPSKAEGRRLVQQNGLSINDEKVQDPNMVLDNSFVGEKGMIIRKGKKVYHKFILK